MMTWKKLSKPLVFFALFACPVVLLAQSSDSEGRRIRDPFANSMQLGDRQEEEVRNSKIDQTEQMSQSVVARENQLNVMVNTQLMAAPTEWQYEGGEYCPGQQDMSNQYGITSEQVLAQQHALGPNTPTPAPRPKFMFSSAAQKQNYWGSEMDAIHGGQCGCDEWLGFCGCGKCGNDLGLDIFRRGKCPVEKDGVQGSCSCGNCCESGSCSHGVGRKWFGFTRSSFGD